MRNKKSVFVILLLLLVGVSSIYVARTYANILEKQKVLVVQQLLNGHLKMTM